MNLISQLRKTVRENGSATITAEQYDQLQAEWITRASITLLEGWDAEFLSKRLGRVAKLAGVPMPDMSHEGIAECAGTILGTIASKLEKQAGQSVPEGLIDLLKSIRPEFGDVGTRDIDVRRKQEQIDAAITLLSASVKPQLVPDSECKQGKCANVTTGCFGECSMKSGLLSGIRYPQPPAQGDKP